MTGSGCGGGCGVSLVDDGAGVALASHGDVQRGRCRLGGSRLPAELETFRQRVRETQVS